MMRNNNKKYNSHNQKMEEKIVVVRTIIAKVLDN